MTAMCVLFILQLSLVSVSIWGFSVPKSNFARIAKLGDSRGDMEPLTPKQSQSRALKKVAATFLGSSLLFGGVIPANAEYPLPTAAAGDSVAKNGVKAKAIPYEGDWGAFKVPVFHNNQNFKDYIGKKATILFNVKIDDSQTPAQFPAMGEILRKYKGSGLAVHGFPTEQGWFEADDDETIREKGKVYYNFGEGSTQSEMFDKVDLLGPSAHPLFNALTQTLPTPNGYGRITLNYEKFLLDSTGKPVRRYPRKFSVYDMEADIKALLNDEPLPEPTEAYLKAWREAKREAVKSEYAFRYNYNYYSSPESMYKYNEQGVTGRPTFSDPEVSKIKYK